MGSKPFDVEHLRGSDLDSEQFGNFRKLHLAFQASFGSFQDHIGLWYDLDLR